MPNWENVLKCEIKYTKLHINATMQNIYKNIDIPEKHLVMLHWLFSFDYVDYNKLENSERGGNTRSPYLPAEKPASRSRCNG